MTLDDKLAQYNDGELRGAAAKLSRKTGAPPNLVSMWRGGTMPGEKYIGKVLKELDVTRAELVAMIKESKRASAEVPHGADVVREISLQSGYGFIDVPHLGTVRADRFSFSFDLPPENFTTLAVKGKTGERYAVLRISGDCMSPKIEDGDEVLIRQTPHVEDGTIAVVCFDGECTLKRIYRKKDGVELRADNPDYQPRRYASNKVRVLAEVVKILKDPRRKP